MLWSGRVSRHRVLKRYRTDPRDESQCVCILVLQLSDSEGDFRDPFINEGSSNKNTVLGQGTSVPGSHVQRSDWLMSVRRQKIRSSRSLPKYTDPIGCPLRGIDSSLYDALDWISVLILNSVFCNSLLSIRVLHVLEVPTEY